jgi:hypothetical protein
MYIEAAALDRRMVEIQPVTKVVSILLSRLFPVEEFPPCRRGSFMPSRFIPAVDTVLGLQSLLLLPTFFPVVGSFFYRRLSFLLSNAFSVVDTLFC